MKNIIKQARESKGLKQEDLAQLIGVSKNTISSWETGKTYPRIDQLEKLVEVIDICYDCPISAKFQKLERALIKLSSEERDKAFMMLKALYPDKLNDLE